MKKIDLTGNRYGHLTVIKENGRIGKTYFGYAVVIAEMR